MLLDLAALRQEKATLTQQLGEERSSKEEHERRISHLHQVATSLANRQQTAEEAAAQLHAKYKQAVRVAQRSQVQSQQSPPL